MEIEFLNNTDSAREISKTLKSAWGSEALDQDLKDIFLASNFNGGISILARENGEIVGISFCFPGYRKGKLYLYSHLTGVSHESKGRGIGLSLKMAQKEWALENGYDLIAWTFDPLMNMNASLNIGKLGSISRTYLSNFYGKIDDKINYGISTDRLVAEWWLRKPKQNVIRPDRIYDLTEDRYDLNNDAEYETLGLKIPEDFPKLKKRDMEEAQKIRNLSAKMFSELFKEGYMICGYSKESFMYILSRKKEVLSLYIENPFR